MKTAYSMRAVSTVAIVIVAVIVAAAGAGAYYFASMSGSGNQSNGNSSSNTSSSSSSQSTSPSSTTQSSATQVPSTSQASTSTQPSTISSASISTSTQQPSTTQTISSSTCTATITSNTGTYNPGSITSIQADLNLIKAIPRMSINWNGSTTSNGNTTSYEYSGTYNVASQTTSGSITTYKVVINLTESSTNSFNGVAWVQSDGTVTALELNYGGYKQNFTGSEATSLFTSYMVAFTLETTLVSEIQFYSSSLFTNSGTATVTLGPTTMTVNTYSATNINYSSCGVSTILSSFEMQYGTVPNTSVTLVTYLHFKGTTQTSSGTENSDYAISVTSIG